MNFLNSLRALLNVGMLLLALPVSAHQVGISRGVYRVEASSVQAELVFARPEMLLAMPGLDANNDGRLSEQELSRGRDRLASQMLDGLAVSSQRAACDGALEHAALTENDGLSLRLHYRCPAAAPAVQLRLSLLSSLSLGHRHLASLRSSASAETITQVVFEAKPDFELSAQASPATNRVAGPLFALGVEHILGGFDHLVFLLGVILIGGKLRSLVLAITAFTLAHSLTLGLAALGIWAPSPDLVEPVIALSIVYVGVENWFAKDASRRWLLTFPFGLIHGFGFAGALQEIALPAAQLPLALLSFNLGVEAGQILVLALLLPILLWLRRRPWFARQGVRSTSGLIAVAGAVWFVQRVVWV